MASNVKKILAISSGHLFHDLFPAFVPAITFLLKDRFQLSYLAVTLMIVAARLPSILNPFIGVIVEKFGLKYFVILTPFLTSLFIGLIGGASSYSAVLLIILISGISSQFYHVPTPVLVKNLSQGNVGRNMSFFMIGGEAARTLGPVLIMWFLSFNEIGNMYVLSVLGLFSSLTLYYFLRNDVTLVKRTDQNRLGFMDSLGILLKEKELLYTMTAVILCKSFTASVVIGLISIYLNELGCSSFVSGGSLSIIAAAGIVGVSVSGILSDKIGRFKTIRIYTVMAPLSLLLFLISDGIMLPFSIFIFGLMSCSITPVMMTYVQEIGARIPSFSNGIYMTFSFLLTSIIVITVGQISDLIGIKHTLYGCFILSFVGFCMLTYMKKKINLNLNNNNGTKR